MYMIHLLLMIYLFFLCLGLEMMHLSALSLREKVGQMLMVYVEGDEERLIREAKVGGIILYNWANDLSAPEKVRDLCNRLQELAVKHRLPPLFLAVDQEGGRVARLKSGFTEFAGNGALGRAGRPVLAYKAALAMGREMRSVGVNWNLAPVVDINNLRAVMGTRSFGADPVAVSELAEGAVDGYSDAGEIACLKHFPGLGDADADSHEALPVVSKSEEELEKCELVPYRRLAAKADAIMTAHVLLPKIDPDNPATVSERILQGILRTKLGFRGVIISDSIVMKGILAVDKIEEVAVRAIEAGCDIILIGGRDLQHKTASEVHCEEVMRIQNYVLAAVESGRISEARIDASVERILALKQKIRKEAGMNVLQCRAHAELSREIALRAFPLSEEECGYSSFAKGVMDEWREEKQQPVVLSEEECRRIGERIWKNETGGREDLLTFWNEKEGFPSMGIGHFIWPPKGYVGPFSEGRFHHMIAWMQEEGNAVPEIAKERYCPWSDRSAFYDAFASKEMEELRKFLKNSAGVQARYMAHRLNAAYRDMVLAAPEQERRRLIGNFFDLLAEPQGAYILIDYLNFKHEGLNPLERYHGKGWGLMQVLLSFERAEKPATAFAQAAECILEERVRNAPQPEIEGRFLAGWKKRLATYR